MSVKSKKLFPSDGQTAGLVDCGERIIVLAQLGWDSELGNRSIDTKFRVKLLLSNFNAT